MTKISIAFKAYDAHELLCHAIAEAAGLYRDAGLQAGMIDATFLPDDALPDNTFEVACGAALTGFLAGRQRKIVFVACDKPMFWLYGRSGVKSVAQLSRGRVATFPDIAPPARLLHRFLAGAGVAPALLPCRDDTARLALVRTGSVDAALLSSVRLPHDVEAQGPHMLAFIGDTERLPSTGLAVSAELEQTKPELVAAMVKIYRQAMKYVFDDNDAILRSVLVEAFGMPVQGLETSIKTIRDCYNPIGYSCDSLIHKAVEEIAATLGLAPRPPEQLYEFKYIKPLG